MRKGGDGDSLAGTSYKWGGARGHVCVMWILFSLISYFEFIFFHLSRLTCVVDSTSGHVTEQKCLGIVT